MFCLYCGADNQKFATLCNSCKKDISTPENVVGHLGQLLRASEKVKDLSITIEEFKTVVNRMEDITKQFAGDLSIPVDDDIEVSETLTQAQKGVSITMGAIKEFHKYFDSEDINYITRGISMVHQAYDLSNRSYKELENLKKKKDAGE